MYVKAHIEIHFVWYHGIQLWSGHCRRSKLLCYWRSILQLLWTFDVADVRCCNETSNFATISVLRSKWSLPPKLNSHVQIMFMHTAMIVVLLPQMFCWPSNFSRCFFFVKFKTLDLTIEQGLASKLHANSLSSNWRKLFKMSSCRKVTRPGNWH